MFNLVTSKEYSFDFDQNQLCIIGERETVYFARSHLSNGVVFTFCPELNDHLENNIDIRVWVKDPKIRISTLISGHQV
jgi:hypothetical protein